MTQESIGKRDNFLHKTTNISEWMKEETTNFINIKGYSVVLFNVDAEIMTRMEKITIMNSMDIKIINNEGEVLHLENYSSSNKDYDDMNLKWLVDFIKECETKALLKFGGHALGTENHSKEETKEVEFEVTGKKKYEHANFSIFFTATVAELINFFENPNFLKTWGGPDSEISENLFIFENVTLKDIKNNKNTISMEYKWNDWNEFSKVSIELSQVGEAVKVTVNHKLIPVGLMDNVINHWMNRIFYTIPIMFRCPMRKE